jgi:hypothetical protein
MIAALYARAMPDEFFVNPRTYTRRLVDATLSTEAAKPDGAAVQPESRAAQLSGLRP